VTHSVHELLQPGGPVARRLQGFEVRPQQLQLAVAIERAFTGRRHLVAEAGTGVGKSFSYLLPAALHADQNQGQGPVVISTRTIALQEQLEKKDLPFLHAVLPFEWSSTTAVGRNNYLCLRRMHLAEREQSMLENEDRRSHLRRIVDWSMTARETTRMELPFPPLADVWEEVQAEHGNCLNRACSHYERCGWQRARRRAETAQVLIVNHSLYFADLALRLAGATFLPEHKVVVFDEAHHLERVATESLGLRVSAATVGWHLKRLHPRRSDHSLLRRHGTPAALVLLEELRVANDAFFSELEAHAGPDGRDGNSALGDETLAEPLTPLLVHLSQELGAAAMRIEQVDVRMELQARSSGLVGLANVIRSLCDPKSQTGPALIRWVEGSKYGPVLCGAPLDVSSVLRDHLFKSGPTCVLTSATLGPGDDEGFAWVRGQLGLDGDRVDTLRLGSPFDYERNVRLVIESDMPDPSGAPTQFKAAVGDRTKHHVLRNGGHALVLCTSWDFVRFLKEALADDLHEEGIPLLVQGESPLAKLLEQKRAEPSSVLIGTDSLWEGIDVPGEALTLVIVTRLPFQNPSHPLTKARMQAIADKGGDPFRDWSLPEAILKFRQGFGRLIRSQQDHGKVIVLDPRARTKGYGRRFLASLPVQPVLDDDYPDLGL
jgi:ATP-dependent DNA helicase DinG